MTPRSVTACVLLAVGILLGAAGKSHAVSPIGIEAPSEMELKILQLLSQKELTVETLSPLLSGMLSKEFGRDHSHLILAAAVRSGSLDEHVVLEAISALGCRPLAKQGTGQCRAFRDGFSAAQRWRPKPADLAGARTQLLQFAKEHTGGHLGIEANYAAALIDSRNLTAANVLELFVAGDLRSLESPAEEEAFGAMGWVTFDPVRQFDVTHASNRLRSALGSAFAQRLGDSQGDPALVTQVRAIPADLLERSRELNDRYWPNFLDKRNLCVLDRWRADKDPPDRWSAWSQMLGCRGW